VGTSGYLQHGRDWTMTRDAIVRLAARLGRAFTYGELSAEIEDCDGLKIDGRGYAGALEAVARNQLSTEPLWTTMVINADTAIRGSVYGTPTLAIAATPMPERSLDLVARHGWSDSERGASPQPAS
jgi:hypothetical protein